MRRILGSLLLLGIIFILVNTPFIIKLLAFLAILFTIMAGLTVLMPVLFGFIALLVAPYYMLKKRREKTD